MTALLETSHPRVESWTQDEFQCDSVQLSGVLNGHYQSTGILSFQGCTQADGTRTVAMYATEDGGSTDPNGLVMLRLTPSDCRLLAYHLLRIADHL